MKHLAENYRSPETQRCQVAFRKIGSRLCTPKSQPPSEAGNEIWFLTLSDLLMLLMICFVLLFGITLHQQDKIGAKPPASVEKILPVAAVIKQTDPLPKDVPDPAGRAAASLKSDLLAVLEGDQNTDQIAVESHSRYIILTFPEQIIFDSGQARLKPSARPVLEKIASFIQDHSSLSVEIHGHTDDLPINSRQYPSNWELSADRATQVAKALIQFGIDPTSLSTKGFGEYHPLYPNDSEANRLKNRRVELKFSLSESA